MANYQLTCYRDIFALSPPPVQAEDRRANARQDIPFTLEYSDTLRSPQPESSPQPHVLRELPSFFEYLNLPRSPPPPSLPRAVLPSLPYNQRQAAMENTRPRLWDVSADAANAATEFIQNHTALDHSVPLLDECPICLDPYDTENCLRITGIPGCEHYVGQKCLEEMLRTRPLEEKKCPLCRAIWIPAYVPPQRYYTPAYHDMIGIGGPDMRDNAPFADFPTQPAPRPNVPSAQGDQTHSDPHPQPSSEVIFIDSDSEDDYQTQVQNFEAFNRDIADIRNRARNTQLSGRRRHQRSTSGTANPSRNSGNGSENTGGRANARPGGFNRFLNRNLNRNLNPFKPLANAPPLSSDSGVRRRSSPQTRRERRSPLQEVRPAPVSPGSSHTVSPTREVPRQRDSTQMSGERPDVVMEMPPDVVEAPTIQSHGAREIVRSLQLDQREQELDRREAALADREAEVARREDVLTTRTVRADAVVKMARRHLIERERFERAQVEELDGLMDG